MLYLIHHHRPKGQLIEMMALIHEGKFITRLMGEPLQTYNCNNNNNNDHLFNLFVAQTELQGGSLVTYKYFGIMTRKYNCWWDLVCRPRDPSADRGNWG